jgi:tetratricopeptide (TPR) repeat protein/predicted Ser/Thr protein kinase
MNETVGSGRRARSAAGPLALERGTSVGRYLILEEIGKGGMGVVYKAYDPELDRQVALKLIVARESASDSVRERLMREAQALARLQHPNVIAVYDVGRYGAAVFIAMEFVEGKNLRAWLEVPRKRREILGVFLAAGEGLAAAHHAKLVHRDFKPDNVMVGNDGRVRVLDFGVARAAGQEAPTDEEIGAAPAAVPAPAPAPSDSQSSGRLTPKLLSTPLTQTGAIIGTPRFMSPEQHLGAVADPRADQFSFCVSLHWALYGAFPFQGATPQQTVDAVVAGKIADPLPGATVPRWLRQVIVRGLARDPDQRYPSMDTLLTALRADPGAALVRRLRAGGVALVALGAILGWQKVQQHHLRACAGAERNLAGIWDDTRRAEVRAAFRKSGLPYAEGALNGVERAFDAYVRAWVAMHGDACEATRVRGEQSEELLDLRMECLGQRLQEVKAEADLFARADAKVIENAVQAVDSLSSLSVCADAAALRSPVRPPTDPQARARATRVRAELAEANAMERAGLAPEALRALRSTAEAAHALGYRPLEGEALTDLGSIESVLGDYDGSERHLQEGVLAAMAGGDKATAARAFGELVWTAAAARRFDDGIRWAGYATALLESGGSEQTQAQVLNSLGFLYDSQGKYEEAVAQHRRALALKEKLYGPSNERVTDSLDNLGLALSELGRYEEGEKYLRRALEIDEKAFGSEHPELLAALNNLGSLLNELGRTDEALMHLRRALRLAETALGSESFQVAMTLTNIGGVLEEAGRHEEALATFRRSLDVCSKVFGPDHPNLAYPLTGIGQAAQHLGATRAAADALERALALRLANPGRPSELAQTRFALATALWDLGKRPRARTEATQALKIYASEKMKKKEIAKVEGWLKEHQR